MKSWARSSPEEMKGELHIRIYWAILTCKTFENFYFQFSNFPAQKHTILLHHNLQSRFYIVCEQNFMNDEYAFIERIGNERRHRLCIKLLPINWRHQHVSKTVWTICRNKYFIPLTCSLNKIGHLCSKTSNIEIRFTLLSWLEKLISVV